MTTQQTQQQQQQQHRPGGFVYGRLFRGMFIDGEFIEYAPSEENRVVASEAAEAMRDRGGAWAVYQNLAMDSAFCGHLQFLKVGPGCTYQEPPKSYPDTRYGAGWKYLLVGWFDPATGAVVEHKPSP